MQGMPGAMRAKQLESNKSWAPGAADAGALQEPRQRTLMPRRSCSEDASLLPLVAAGWLLEDPAQV